MKKRYAVVFMLSVICTIALVCLSACSTNSENNKQTPVYQGMTLSSSIPQSASIKAMRHHGDYHGKDHDIDKDHPFDNSTIEGEIESSLDVEGSEDVFYYAKPNEDMFITIHLSNPDNFEILSFTLNGQKYSNYMFEYGSDMENLILKFNVGEQYGFVEYTIDAIKYVDGTEIKDVIMDGDKTVKAGIYSDNLPQVTITNTEITTDKISFTSQIADPLNLITLSDGKVTALIYDGENILDSKEIGLGETSIVFDSLSCNTLYQYAIVASYDNLDGEGFRSHILTKEAFFTEAIVLFDDISSTQDSIQFSLYWKEDWENKTLASLSLWKGSEKIKDLQITDRSVSGLLSDTEYRLLATYRSNVAEEKIELFVTTLAKTEPTVEISDINATQNSVKYKLTVSDPDSLCKIGSIELLDEKGNIIQEGIADQTEFADLLSDTNYTLKVNYIYDLNNGFGTVEQYVTADFTTLAKTVPSINITDIAATQSDVSCSLEINDPDSLCTIDSIQLLDEEGDVLDSTTSLSAHFSNLESATQYTVRVNYSFDLNNGEGKQTKSVEKDFYTLAKDVSITKVDALGETTIVSGDNVALRITVSNPDDVEIRNFVVNGQTVEAQKAGQQTYLLNYVPSLTGGQQVISIDEIICRLYESEYRQSIHYETGMELTVLGNVYVTDFTLKEGRDYYEKGETIVAYIDFMGAEGYTLTSVKFNSADSAEYPLTKITDTRYSVELQDIWGWNDINKTVTLYSLTYGIGEATNTCTLSNLVLRYFILESNVIRDIDSAQELQSMENGYAYRLKNNIDLEGFDWSPYDFKGYIDGNGFSINNLTIKKSITTNYVGDEDRMIGLFRHSAGCFKNLTLNNAAITVNSNYRTDFNLGFIVGCIDDNGYIDNCIVNGDITVITEGAAVGSIGGLIGYGQGGTINNCLYEGSIFVSMQNSECDGAIGSLIGFRGSAYNSLSSADITVLLNGAAKVISELVGGQVDVHDCYFAPAGTELQKHTIRFDSNGGTKIDDYTGYFLPNADTPTKPNAIFRGWYFDKELTQAVSFPYLPENDITLYAKWFDLGAMLEMPESDGLEIENGIIVGIGNCTDEILVLNHPIAEHAFSDLWDSNFHTVIIQKGVTQIGDRAFSSCSFKEVYFLSEIPPQIGDDLFANTWNAYDFNIYVPFAGLNAYKNISAEYWDNAIPHIKGFEIKL